jgi:SAM-dependent methyltransferase/uncharacterized protein YbaR (Trm112 family)
MHVELPQLAPLICPACRRITERGRELWTLSVCTVIRTGASADDVLEGSLRCDNLGCQRRYPIVDGIPIVVLDAAGLLAGQPAAFFEPLSVDTLSILVEGATDDAPLSRLLEHLSIYLDAHFGDRSRPPPGGPQSATGWGGAALFSAVARLAARPAARAVELGCSVGRGLLSLQGGAQFTLGVDLHLGALRAARRILGGQPLPYARRAIGRHYQTAEVVAGPAVPVHLVCADALDPPLAPQAFERVVALNLLDSVRTPRQLLAVVDGLCASGGELLLASPYAWQSGVVDETERLGGAAPELELRRILSSGDGLEAPYAILVEEELPWHLRRDARSAHSYVVHTLHARKI